MKEQVRSGARMHGLMAEFETPDALLSAAHTAHEAGYRVMDAYTPFPVEGLADALGHGHSRLPFIVLAGGAIGLVGGYALQHWSLVTAYPMNVGGRPLHSWPAFIPVTFETTVLLSALFTVLGLMALIRLPMPYHPVFNVERFKRATSDRYYLCIESADPRFDREATERFLRGLDPSEVSEVED
jgi:hypothetical protein